MPAHRTPTSAQESARGKVRQGIGVASQDSFLQVHGFPLLELLPDAHYSISFWIPRSHCMAPRQWIQGRKDWRWFHRAGQLRRRLHGLLLVWPPCAAFCERTSWRPWQAAPDEQGLEQKTGEELEGLSQHPRGLLATEGDQEGREEWFHSWWSIGPFNWMGLLQTLPSESCAKTCQRVAARACGPLSALHYVFSTTKPEQLQTWPSHSCSRRSRRQTSCPLQRAVGAHSTSSGPRISFRTSEECHFLDDYRTATATTRRWCPRSCSGPMQIWFEDVQRSPSFEADTSAHQHRGACNSPTSKMWRVPHEPSTTSCRRSGTGRKVYTSLRGCDPSWTSPTCSILGEGSQLQFWLLGGEGRGGHPTSSSSTTSPLFSYRCCWLPPGT